MAQLFVLSGPDVGRSFELDGPTTLGRSPDCDVRLRDRSISRQHARVEPADGGWVIVDLGSRNGVRLHGKRVERAVLSDLDEVLLGELALRFRSEAEVETTAPPPPPPATPAPAPEARAPSSAPAAGDDDGGFELEEDVDLAAPTAFTPRGTGGTGGAAAADPVAASSAKPPVAEVSERDLARARILAQGQGSSLLSGDLSQWPLPLRWAAYLLVLAVMAGLFYGAYKLMATLRGTV